MLRHFSAFIILLAILGPPLRAGIWPEVTSDLPQDPTIRWGKLPNGVRYAVRPNQEPKGRVSLRLVVAVGSLHERDDERGLAHFVEHMIFRGTRQHPNGSLAAEFQRLGMSVGPESTAFTHPDHTIYHLDLPSATETMLRQGLSIFREYVSEVTFAPELIEKERGVVLNELVTRDTPDARAGDRNQAFLWPNSRQAARRPIGLESAIRTFTREQFVGFYDAWYRPDRIAVIVVGDLDPALAETLVKETFESFTGRGEPREDGSPFIPEGASRADIRIHSDPGLLGASCLIEHPFREPRVPDTHARRVQLLHRSLALAVLQRRLARDAADAEGPAISPVIGVSTPMPGWGLVSMGGNGRINNWREFMSDLEQQHRRALLHGFTRSELDAVKIGFVASYAEAVRSSRTWPSGWMAEQIASSLLEGTGFSTPAFLQADLAAEIQAATPADCLAEFRRIWTAGSPHVFISTHPDFNVSASQIAEALNTSRQIATPPLPDRPIPKFAYTEFGPAGQIEQENFLSDLEVYQARFANGVRLNFKNTDFEANTVVVNVRVGRGKLTQPKDQPGLDLLANHMLNRGGLGRHTFEELQDVLNGHIVSVGFTCHWDAFEFSARCAPADLPLTLQLITAHLTDAAFRPSARRQVDAIFGSIYANLAASPGGPLAVFSQRVMSNGDRRLGMPLFEELYSRKNEELRRWLEPEFKNGAIELSVVGVTSWEGAKSAVAQTLAALPNRRAEFPRGTEDIHPVKPKKDAYAYATAPQLKQVALAWYSPIDDVTDIHRERRCRLLADIMNERLRLRLREELGAVYGCSTELIENDVLPRFSYFAIYTEVAPEHTKQADALIRAELERMQTSSLTADEFERAKQPFLRHREQDLRENGYWAFTVLRDAQERPKRIAAARDRASDTAAITLAEVESLARRYFNPKRAFRFISYPGAQIKGDLRFGK